MADTLRVRAVEGRLFPWENNARRGHVGWSPTPEGEDFDHEIPDVVKLTRSDEPIEVPNTVYYRRGIADGDLEEASVDDTQDDGEEDAGDDNDEQRDGADEEV